MERVEDKSRAILDATLGLMAEKGFRGTAMAEVAPEAVACASSSTRVS
jgi:AcrR family transcriptional regulator